MTTGNSIDYDQLTQDALRGLVRTVLTQVAESGLPGEHHFYVAFNTQAPGVGMSRRLKEKYPDEMMIVLQHRFWDLAVTDAGFEVKLTFDGIPERLYVPFEALRVFFDPSVRFTLQFGTAATGDEASDGMRRRRDGNEAGQRAGDRRGRGRTKSKSETETTPPVAVQGTSEDGEAPQPAPPTVLAPRSADSPRPVPMPAAGAGNGASAPEAPQPGGAKVFSLDQFRKK